jgi:hypothetical protein
MLSADLLSSALILEAMALARAYTRDPGGDYLEAVAVMRGLYDIVDGFKRWEEDQPDGADRASTPRAGPPARRWFLMGS